MGAVLLGSGGDGGKTLQEAPRDRRRVLCVEIFAILNMGCCCFQGHELTGGFPGGQYYLNRGLERTFRAVKIFPWSYIICLQWVSGVFVSLRQYFFKKRSFSCCCRGKC